MTEFAKRARVLWIEVVFVRIDRWQIPFGKQLGVVAPGLVGIAVPSFIVVLVVVDERRPRGFHR